jgi:hypothetical protein
MSAKRNLTSSTATLSPDNTVASNETGRTHTGAAARWRESDILDWIHRLTTEKDQLRRSHQGRPLSSDETTHLKEVESTLDESWDLVRRRRARRAAGAGWDDLSDRVAELFKRLKG